MNSQFSSGVNLDWGRLWRLKGTIFASTLTAMLLGAIYVYLSEPIYEAEARILAEPTGLSAVDADQSTRYREFLATQGEILRSPLMINAALSKVQLSELKGVASEKRIALVMESLQVSPVVNTDVLRIWFRGSNPDDTVMFIRAITAEYKAYTQKTERNRYSETLQLLSSTEEQLRDELLDQSNKYEELRKKNSLVGKGNDLVNLKLVSLRGVEMKLRETRSRRVDLEIKSNAIALARTATASGKPEETVLAFQAALNTQASGMKQIPRRSTRSGSQDRTEPFRVEGISEIYRDLWLAKSHAAEVAQQYGPAHQATKAANEQVAVWSENTREHVESLVAWITQELKATQIAEEQLQELYEQDYVKLKQLDNDSVREDQFLGNIARLEEAHSVTMNRLREFRLADQSLERGHASTHIRVLQPPAYPVDPVWPKPIPVIGMSGVLGLLLSSVAIIFLGSLDQDKDEDELNQSV